MSSSEPGSHAVGTTVRVQDFLKHVPVRRQTVLKSSVKILTTIKKLLQSYAFARPHIRFSVKVLKSKDEKHNWMYGATSTATTKDVAAQVGGHRLASECEIETNVQSQEASEADKNEVDASMIGSTRFRVSALLPKVNAGKFIIRSSSSTDPILTILLDLSRVGNLAHFVAIDGRPINTNRGFGKDLVKLFRTYVRSSGTQSNETRFANDSFLCMHIDCPPGSYDINVEPAKDDLIFVDVKAVLTQVEGIFERFYGHLPSKKSPAIDKDLPRESQSGISQLPFDLLLATPLLEVSPSKSVTRSSADLKPIPAPSIYDREAVIAGIVGTDWNKESSGINVQPAPRNQGTISGDDL